VNITDIFVSTSGQIYVNDTTNSVLFKFNDNPQTQYLDKFAGIYAEGIISLQNNQVIRTKFLK
jgi:hypothetical protein